MRTAALFSLSDAHRIPPLQCLSSSQHIHMVGLYSSLHPLTYMAPVGIQFRYNHDGCISPLPTAHTTLTPPPSPKPLLLLLPQGPDSALLALRPFRCVRPQGEHGYVLYTSLWCAHIWILWYLCARLRHAGWLLRPVCASSRQPCSA